MASEVARDHAACSIRVRGVVQGVGFRPFVCRLAQASELAGWVRNEEAGVEICIEGSERAIDAFIHSLKAQAPPAATIAEIAFEPAEPAGLREFTIRESRHDRQGRVLSARIPPDLPVCDACLAELFNPRDRRHHYPYINCSHCGPRYSVLLGLPYDRARTTMNRWPLDESCAAEYLHPLNRRFHAEPVACPACGPHYELRWGEERIEGDEASINGAAELLRAGRIVAVKGLGGYHLACDAANAETVANLRDRKYRKEKPFALMVSDLEVARRLGAVSAEAEELLLSTARPIVLIQARTAIPGVAPDNHELGLMLPYAPLHYLLFAAGAPSVLVMTSANRSSEPIAYEDEDAFECLVGIADAFLVGQRPIARRVEDSVARAGVFGPVILRRSRGYAPGVAATLPVERPILAVGADLKNTITLVVKGQALVSQHLGDLTDFRSLKAFRETIQDLLSMYEISESQLLVAYDAHPQYASTAQALELPARDKCAIQHHRAHLASVLAERGAWDERVIGVSADGTGYGDDGSIWGGEIFVGGVAQGFKRVAHLRPAVLPGGDAAALRPAQAAAGFLTSIDGLPDLMRPPFNFPEHYRHSLRLTRQGVRTFPTTSLGRLFDSAAALLGFTRAVTFEGQAAMWLEYLACRTPEKDAYPFPFDGEQLDFRPLLLGLARDRLRGRAAEEIARAFQKGVAHGLSETLKSLCRRYHLGVIVLSGGVFQNELLLEDIKRFLEPEALTIWTNHAVPPNDGGISLGQAALAAFGTGSPEQPT